MTNIGGREVGTNDLGMMGGGLAALIFSIFPFYGYSGPRVPFAGSASVTAWHYGLSLLGLLLLLAVAVIVSLRVFGVFNLPAMPVGPSLALLVGAGLGTFLIIVRTFTLSTASYGPASVGPKFGAYLLILSSIAVAVFAFLAFRASGEAMPDFSAMKSSGSAPAAPPTPPTYSPPPAAPPTYSPPPASPPTYPPPTPPAGGLTSE